jgi:hypothetical protein
MPRDGSGIDTTLTGIASRGLQEAARALARNVSAGNRERIAALMATQDPAQLRRLVTEILSATPARDATQAGVRNSIVRLLSGAPATTPSFTNR